MTHEREHHPRYEGFERRNGNGDWTASLPVWMRAIVVLGPTTVIAVGLVWVLAQTLPSIWAEIKQIHAVVDSIKEGMIEHRKRQEDIYRAVILDCVNRAKDENARQNCFK